jgi:DNA-directed RNA polymerase specialized sigma24 family protein
MEDERLFLDAYQRHHPPVLAYLRRSIDGDRARELADEVFLVAWRRRGEAPTADLPWLLTTARLLLQNERRANVRNSALEHECAQLARRSVEPDPSAMVIERLRVLAPWPHCDLRTGRC